MKRLVRAALLMMVSVSAAFAQKLAPAMRVWSVGPLTKSEPGMGIALGTGGATVTGPHEDSQTKSIFAATRSVVFAGDRVVLASMVGMRRVEGGEVPEQIYRLLSLDSKTGEIRDTREITAFASLKVLATNDAHVIVSGKNVFRLTADLKDDSSFDYHASGRKYGDVQNVSPDGTTLGNATNPGFELIDSRTLKARVLTMSPANDASVSNKGFVTDIVHWTRDYPNDLGFITYTDATGVRLLYHGKCGSGPQFLTDDLVFAHGCQSFLILDTHGNIVRTVPLKGAFSYAGTSQNGRRLALQIESGKHERFAIYSVETGEPIAEVKPDKPAEEGQSWTAFSPDGSLFVVGSPLKLTLYHLPEAPHTDATTEIVDPKTGNLHVTIPLVASTKRKQ